MRHINTTTTFLAFDKEAGEAVEMYVAVFASVFGESRILKTTYYGERELAALAGVPEMSEGLLPGSAGSIKTVRFSLNGLEFMAMNGGPFFGRFNESVSLYVECETQEQIDVLWGALTRDGEEQQCGWLKDKYGLSWQIAPAAMRDIMEGPDEERAQRVMLALLQMKKIDISVLQQA